MFGLHPVRVPKHSVQGLEKQHKHEEQSLVLGLYILLGFYILFGLHPVRVKHSVQGLEKQHKAV